MIKIGSFKDINDSYDEVWMIVRSLKTAKEDVKNNIYHVPQLSPSWDLFKDYRNWTNAGIWDNKCFMEHYVPRFLNEIRNSKEAKQCLNVLYQKSKIKNILLVCFCTKEELCHRSIIVGLLQGVGADIECNDYSFYYEMYIKDNNIQTEKTVSFTGRRPKDLLSYADRYVKDNYMPLFNFLKAEFKKLYEEENYTTFISGGAQGFDQMVFWAVNSLKNDGLPLRNIVYVPFKGQERAWAKTGLFSQKEYNHMLSLADEVNILVDHVPDNVPQTMHSRNHAMVDNSDLVIGLYPDDTWKTATRGGTAECLNYALKHNKEILQITYKDMNEFSLS